MQEKAHWNCQNITCELSKSIIKPGCFLWIDGIFEGLMKGVFLHKQDFFRFLSVPNENSRLLAIGKLTLPFLIICIQNFVIFYKHYLHDFGFPWDFPMGYYAITAYWTNLASQGYIPTWIPYQQMGYPMALQLQSGIHYPPFWFFPLLKIEYTLNAAVIFQCLHILFGTLGMFLFLRLAFKSNLYALIGAFSFQFFGGFYSNAQHADIVRAFSYAPWFLYCFFIEKADLKLSWRYLLIPLLILFMSTGGYPGNLISSIAVTGIFVLLQIAQLIYIRADRKRIFQTFAFIGIMAILGVGLSFYHLGPGWIYRSYMARSNADLSFFSLGLEYLPGLFLNNNIFNAEISMTSSFITMPMLILIAYLTRGALKQWWIMAVIGLFSMVMIAGPNSVVWYVITKFASPLQLSRFPASDYRVFVVIPTIFFATLGAKSFIEREINRKGFFIRSFLILAAITQLIYISYLPMHQTIGWFRIEPFVEAFAVLAITSLTLIIYFFIPSRSHFLKFGVAGIFIALMAVDAARVLPEMITWLTPNISSIYQNENWQLEEGSRLTSLNMIDRFPQSRPARIRKESIFHFSWEGYLTGRYIVGDLGPYILKAPYLVDSNPMYREFMEKGWTPLLFQQSGVALENFSISDEAFSRALNERSNDQGRNFIRQTRYGINEIIYEVSLEEPQIFVENEIYFPGWKAYLDFDDINLKIDAFSTNEIYRTWALPPGKYQMVATFEFPYTRIFNGVSIGALIIWMLIFVVKAIKSIT